MDSEDTQTFEPQEGDMCNAGRFLWREAEEHNSKADIAKDKLSYVPCPYRVTKTFT